MPRRNLPLLLLEHVHARGTTTVNVAADAMNVIPATVVRILRSLVDRGGLVEWFTNLGPGGRGYSGVHLSLTPAAARTAARHGVQRLLSAGRGTATGAQSLMIRVT